MPGERKDRDALQIEALRAINRTMRGCIAMMWMERGCMQMDRSVVVFLGCGRAVSM